MLHDRKQVRADQYRPDFCPMSGWVLGRPLVDPDAALERDERTGLKRLTGRVGGAWCGWEGASGWCVMRWRDATWREHFKQEYSHFALYD